MILFQDLKHFNLSDLETYLKKITGENFLLLETGLTKVFSCSSDKDMFLFNNKSYSIQDCINFSIIDIKKSFHSVVNDIKVSFRIKKDKSLELKFKIIYQAKTERFIHNYIYDLKNIKSEIIRKNNDLYSLNLFDKDFYFSFKNKSESNSVYLRKLNKTNNKLEQLEYLIDLIKLNLITLGDK